MLYLHQKHRKHKARVPNASGTRSIIRDYAGQRFEKKVTTKGKITTHQRFIYRNYLQIAAVNLKANASTPDLWFLIWDPTQPIATRPLAIRKDGTWYTYGWDLTKNVCELRTMYSYSPYGTVISEGDVDQSPRGIGGGLVTSQEVPEGRTVNEVAVSQPIQWSSEYYDSEIDLVYYNYHFYNPTDGRWMRRDPIVNLNLYLLRGIDYLGLDNRYGLPDAFWSWFHKCEKDNYVKKEDRKRSKNCPENVRYPKNPDATKEDAYEYYKKWQDLGKPQNCRKKRLLGRSRLKKKKAKKLQMDGNL